MSVYNLIIAIAVILGILPLRSDEDFLFLVVTIPLVVTTLFTMIAVSLPKLIRVYGTKMGRWKRELDRRGGDKGGGGEDEGEGFKLRNLLGNSGMFFFWRV